MDGEPMFGSCDQCGGPRNSAGLCATNPLFHRAQDWATASDTDRARRAEMTPRIQAAGDQLAEELSVAMGLPVAFATHEDDAS